MANVETEKYPGEPTTRTSPGVHHFWLRRAFNSRLFPDGACVLEYEASDVRGNPRGGRLALTFANGS